MSNDGGPAFPGQWIDNDSMGVKRVREQYPGLTKREWFAGMVMMGLCANPESWSVSVDQISHAAVANADALLKELEAKP